MDGVVLIQGKTRQGVNIPRDCNVKPMQIGHVCHRDRREMERGSCLNCPDCRVRQSSEGPLKCAVSRHFDVGAPVVGRWWFLWQGTRD